VVVPVNPMNRGDELRHCLEDAGAATVLATQELWEPIEPLLGTSGLTHAVLSAYSDYLTAPTDLPLPAFVRAPREPTAGPDVTPWAEAIAAEMTPDEQRAGPEDLAVMPYTSGTTGKPKACMHTHRSVLATSTAVAHWRADTSETVALAVLPMFHVGGMQDMNATIQSGGTVVLLTRWDRECATRQIERAGVTTFTAITTMLIDFLSNPGLDRHDLSSLMWLGGGGAAMPEAVARKLETALGNSYIEGYGLS
jgi:fatty-acyl-CoA synthase